MVLQIQFYVELMWILWNTRSFGVESLVWVGTVVDDLQFSLFVEESVTSLQVALAVPLLITELTVVPVSGVVTVSV